MFGPYGRALTGAWIETITPAVFCTESFVAPSRARGLKLANEQGLDNRRLVAPSRARGLKHVEAIANFVA